MSSFAKTAFSGITWTTISIFSRNLVKLLQVAILTRILSKEDFGTIAIASLFIGFTQVFMEMGLSAAIIHKQDITKKHYSSLFWLNVFSGVLLSTLVWFAAVWIAAYYNDESLVPIIRLLGLNILFSSLGRQHRTQRQKQLDFKIMAFVDIIAAIFTFIIAVALARTGYGVYSLVYSTIFGVLIANLVFLVYGILGDKNIAFHFRLSDTYSYLRIGGFKMGSSIVDYLARELDIIIISSTMGRDTLGAYSLCKRIILILYSILSPILMTVLTPMFAEIQKSAVEMRNKFSRLIEIVSTFNYPIFFLVALLAPGLIRILYGETYTEYHLLLTILAINYGILAVMGPLTAVQVALGRTDLGFYWTIFRIISTSIYIYIGSRYSIYGIVIAILVGTVINMIPFWYIQIKKLLSIPLKVFFGNQLIPFVFAGGLFGLLKIFINIDVSLHGMIIFGTIYGIVYMGAMIYSSPKNYLVTQAVGILQKYRRN